MVYGKTAFEQQQDLAKLYSAQGSIIWDLYHVNDKEILEAKLKYLFPNNTTNFTDCKQSKEALTVYWKIQKENDKLEVTRKSIADAIWNQRKFCEGNLLMTIIFALHTPTTGEPCASVKYTTNYTYHPLFRIRKCKKNNTSNNCCSIFVDSIGRVYQNWQDFILNNKLPEGIVITPEQGVYTFDDNDEVILEYLSTPSSSKGKTVLKVMNYSAAALGVGAAVVLPVAAFAAPLAAVAAPVSLGCTVVGSLIGSWSIGRYSANLADRSRHEQSINLTDREARSSWINIASGAVGIGASTLSQGFSIYAATAKTFPQTFQRAVIGINGLSIATNGIGIGNNIVDTIMKCRDDESLTSMDVLGLSASLLLFTHSICNLRIATKMVISSKSESFSIRSFLDESNTCNIKNILTHIGKVLGNEKLDIIRPLRKIASNKFSSDIVHIMKQINNNSEGPSQNTNRNFSKIKNTQLISINSPNIDSNTTFLIIDLITTLKEMFFIGSDHSLADVLLNIAEKVATNVLLELIQMAQNYVFELIIPFQKKFHMIPFESIIWELFTVAEQLSVKNITVGFLRFQAQRICERLKEFYGKFISNSGEEKECGICGGSYTITASNI